MEIKRTTEIFVETKRRFIISPPEAAAENCPTCGGPIITAEAAAVLLDVKNRFIYRLIESGRIHFAETATGATFVCPSSLESAILEAGAERLPAETIEISKRGTKL